MTVFLSDVHLGLGSRESNRERERRLVGFLDRLGAEGVEALYIVGDLFDYWFEYRSVVPRGFTRTLGAIARLVDAGVPVDYLIGNHDFGHRSFFEQEIGVAMHAGDLERTVHGRRCYIAHGDGKAFNDRGYLVLRAVLRSPVSNSLFRLIHPDAGIGLASWASRRSRDHTERKDYGGGERDGLQAFAEEKILRDGFDLVVMGHNHRPALVPVGSGVYANLGTWLNDRSYLVVDEHEVRLLREE